MERRILVIIETILRAEEALAGLAKLEASLLQISELLGKLGMDFPQLREAALSAGEAYRGLETLQAQMRGMAEVAPKVTASTSALAAGVQAVQPQFVSASSGLNTMASALSFAWRQTSTFVGWLARLEARLRITERFVNLLGRGLRSLGGFLVSAGRSVIGFLNPLRLVSFGVNQIVRSFRILFALMLFQFWRKLQDAVLGFVDALFGANLRVEAFMVRMGVLVGQADRAEAYFGIVREQAIETGVSLDKLAEATFRFASISGKNMQVFQELVARTIQLAFYDPRQGLAGAGMAIMEALTGQFRSLVRRFEIGTLEMAHRMREAGLTNIEILREMMDVSGVTVDVVAASMDTMAGMFRYFEGTLREVARRLGEPIIERFTPQVRELRDWFRETRLELEAFARAVGMILGGALMDMLELFLDFFGFIRPADWAEWGMALMHSLALGLISGAEWVLKAVTWLAGLVADFLMALSPPKRGPLAGIFEGGLGLIREWIKGMESADLSAITRIASYAIGALGFLAAKGLLAAEGLTEYSKAFYELLVRAVDQMRDMGSVSAEVMGQLQALFGELFGDVSEYLGIYEKILDIQVEIEAREAAVAAAEELIKLQEEIVEGERELVEAAREKVDLAYGELEAFRARTKGIPARFLAQRERELEAMIKAAEAEVDAREERLEAAEEELDRRRENLKLAREYLDQAKEQQKVFAEQLKALEAQMSFMQKLWALEQKALEEAEEKRQIGIEEGEDTEARSKREEELRKRAGEFYDEMKKRLGDLRGRYDALYAAARAFFLYDPEDGVNAALASIAETLGRELTPEEEAAARKAIELRQSLGEIKSTLTDVLGTVLEFAGGLFGVGEGEEDARAKGEALRKELEKFWKEVLKPLIESLWSFVAGLTGVKEKGEVTSTTLYTLGQLWRRIAENLGKVMDPLLRLLSAPVVLEIAAWAITILILIGRLGSLLKILTSIWHWGGWAGILTAAGKLAGALGGIGAAAYLVIVAIGALVAAAATFIIALIRTHGDFKAAFELWKRTWTELGRRLFEVLTWPFRKLWEWLFGASWFVDLKAQFQAHFDRILNFLRNLLPNFLQIGKDIISKIVEGAEAVWGNLTALVDRIAALWPFSLARTGPFSVPIRWEMLTEGLDEQLAQAERAITSFAGLDIAVPTLSAEGLVTPLRPRPGLVNLSITNYWSAELSQKDRRELEEMMELTTYSALERVFSRVGRS